MRYPYPVVQGGGANTSVTILFKEFGIRLKFTPTILGDEIIHLKVEPEVSALDFSKRRHDRGLPHPALSTRRTQTEVELRDGQTFAVAGLLNNTLTTSLRKIPGIGDIPILGWLFKSRALQKNETELVVIITPHILRRGSPGAATGLPNLVEPFLGKPDKQVLAAAGAPRIAALPDAGSAGSEGSGVSGRGRGRSDRRHRADDGADARTGRSSGAESDGASEAGAAVHRAGPEAGRAAAGATTASGVADDAEPDAAPAQSAPNPSAPRTAAAPASAAAALTTEEQKRLEAAAKKMAEDRKRAEEMASKQAIADAKRTKEERKEAEERAKEQAKRDARDAKKAEELRKKQAEEDAKRNKAIAEAAARLKEAQAEYQSAVQKTNAQKPKP